MRRYGASTAAARRQLARLRRRGGRTGLSGDGNRDVGGSTVPQGISVRPCG